MTYSVSRWQSASRKWTLGAVCAMLVLPLCGCQPSQQARPSHLVTHGMPELPALPAGSKTMGIYDIAAALENRRVAPAASGDAGRMVLVSVTAALTLAFLLRSGVSG